MLKTLWGGGNSLKLGVESCELGVGGRSSSWRFGKRELGRGKRNFSLFNLHCSLSVLLAGVIALAASGAWAADRIIDADYTLTDYETVDGVLTVASGATVDLKGYHLTVQGLAGDGTITNGAFTISNLSAIASAHW